MKIAFLGYAKMGKIIEKIALDRKHEIVLKIDQDNAHELTAENLQKADVAIEFSTPHTVISNIKKCFDAQVPVVVGTTGWYDFFKEIETECKQKNGTLFHATNFSLGVNLFFKVNSYLADLMNKSQVAASTTHQPFVFFLTAAILYLILTSFSQQIMAKLSANATKHLST